MRLEGMEDANIEAGDTMEMDTVQYSLSRRMYFFEMERELKATIRSRHCIRPGEFLAANPPSYTH